ncbi:MAG: hypothetical protein IJ201_10120 [Solobacterium sp.]|nr:hypothetical protein [Solobacterium sp.]
MSEEDRITAVKRQMLRNRIENRIHRVLFLDFDGVVNVPYEYGTPEFDAAMAQGVYDFFRPEIVERLDKLIHEFDLHVVISSSWRYSGMEFCQNSLRNAGFSEDVIIEDLTVLSEGMPPRYLEILEYLEDHPRISEILILDDIPMHGLSDYAVQTVFEDGYDEAADRQARAILNRQIQTVQTEAGSKQVILLIAIAVIIVLVIVFLYR